MVRGGRGRLGGWGVAGLGEGGCAGANGVVAGLGWTENQRTHEQKRPLPTERAHSPVTRIWPFWSEIDSVTGGYTVIRREIKEHSKAT